jgi:large subunit ribosomal protein L34e
MPKVKVRTPSGRIVINLRRRKPSFAECAVCGKQLHGIPRLVSAQMKKLPKTKRRPERPYGGYLCSTCSRELFREKARKIL